MKKTILLTLSGLALLFVMQNTDTAAPDKAQSLRDLASSHQHSMSHAHTQKLSSPLSLHITSSEGENPVNPTEAFTLTAKITSRQYFPSAQLKWSLPPGVELISGSETIDNVELIPNEPQTFDITLNVTDNLNYQVHANLAVISGKNHIGQTAQYNTQNELIIKKSAKRLHDTNIDFQKKSSKKLIH